RRRAGGLQRNLPTRPGRARHTGCADLGRTAGPAGVPRIRPGAAAPADGLVGRHHRKAAVMTTGLLYAALLGAGTGIGVLLIVRGVAGPSVEQDDGSFARPARWSRWQPGRRRGDGRRLAVSVAVAVLVGVVTRWPVAAVLAAVGAWALPGLIGPDREHQRRLGRIE